MIPAHFLGGARARPTSEPPERGVRVTVERAPTAVVLPPPPATLGRVTETITKSTFTETTVTRITDNQLVEPLIIEVRTPTDDVTTYKLQLLHKYEDTSSQVHFFLSRTFEVLRSRCSLVLWWQHHQ